MIGQATRDPDLAELARRMPLVVTAENHSIIGGLGSAVAELPP
ncbi:transketolase C-terminal domain/subunit [Bradyrhizobium huanghuaihaiense]|uniref:Transketolase n=1 Tax=Bradyrhizobium huanghuaihaiense TaxID=990078 RepID=A0A562RWZ2_9BRAD|nr:hypothetical protein [Bradyrhizobium huanghuaihaiense]TWI72840.1 transketolase [Bradyrhizobium huanghuaihaiense]